MAFDNHNTQKYIYLADYDSDDRDLFADAIQQVDPDAVLRQAQDGMYLMDNLLSLFRAELPDFIFLDINMPCKSGMDAWRKSKSTKVI